MGDDRGNMIAFEGLLVAMILLAAVYAGVALQEPATAPTTPRRELALAASDALVVLDGLREPRGRVLDVSLTEALDCIAGTTPPATLCDGTRPNNLSARLDGYLPQGARYSLSLDNGAEVRHLFGAGTTPGERVSASRAFTPDWNMTFVMTDLSCHDPGMDVNVTLVPIWHGDTPAPRFIDAVSGASVVNATADSGGRAWNATLPPSTIGEQVHSRVNATRGTLAGSTASASCALGASGWALRGGLNLSTVGVQGPLGDAVVPAGGTLGMAYDFSAILLAIPTATLHEVTATVYEPIAPRPEVADSRVVAGVVPMGASWAGLGEWAVPRSSIYGVHPVAFQANLTVPGASGDIDMSVRLVTTTTIALTSGIVPVDPPYRAVLQVWLPDWS